MSEDLSALWDQAKPAVSEDLNTLWQKAKPVGPAPAPERDSFLADSLKKTHDILSPKALLQSALTQEPEGLRDAKLRGQTQGLTAGLSDEAAGAWNAVKNKPSDWLFEATHKDAGQSPSFADYYRQGRDESRAANAQARAAYPNEYETEEGMGTLMSTLIPGLGKQAAATKAAELAPKVLQAAEKAPGLLRAALGAVKNIGAQTLKGGLTAAAQGGGLALGHSNADLTRGDYSGALNDTLKGAQSAAPWGVGFGLLGGALSEAMAGREAIRSTINKPSAQPSDIMPAQEAEGFAQPIAARGSELAPSPQAKALLDRGIPLTVGQRNPLSPLAQMEELSTSAPYIGPAIKEMRMAPQRVWQNSAISEAVPRGGSFPLQGSPADRLNEIGPQFKQAYEEILNGPIKERAQDAWVTPKTLNKALSNITQDRSIRATPAQIDTVNRFLEGQTELATREGGALLPKALHEIRSNIRAEISTLPPGDAERRFLEKANEQVSSRLSYLLPKEQSDALRQVDSGWAKYQTLLDANARSGNPDVEGFSPSHLMQAVKGSVGRTNFAKGNWYELGDLASNAKEVFHTRLEPTGVRLIASKYPMATAALISKVNKPGGLQWLQSFAEPSGIEKLVEALKGGPPSLRALPGGLSAGELDGPITLGALNQNDELKKQRIAALRGTGQ